MPKNFYDIDSELLQARIIFLSGQITDESVQPIIKQLLVLANESDEEIKMFINSPGGYITAGLALHDVMRRIKAPVHTICCGIAASMAAVILAAGNKRSAYPHSKVMIHQPLGGREGQSTDIEIYAKEMSRLRKTLEELLSKYTGQPIRKIHKDCERDKYLTAQEALDYGLIDEILEIG